jgi:hypothetical protein
MTSGIEPLQRSEVSRPEAERQLAAAVALAAANVEATARLQPLTQRILADAANDPGSRSPADLVGLHERLDREWRSWRQTLER